MFVEAGIKGLAHQELLVNRADLNWALGSKRDTRVAAVRSLPPLSTPTWTYYLQSVFHMLCSGHPLDPITLGRTATTTLTPLMFKDLPKHPCSLRSFPSSLPSARSPLWPIPMCPEQQNMSGTKCSIKGRQVPAARSCRSSNCFLQMPWHLGRWAQHPGKASVQKHQHRLPTWLLGWVTC